MIGVSPATLRRWSDAGDIKAFTTPGGHRRFSRTAVLAMLPADRRGRPDLGRLGETPTRMTRIYRRELRRATQWAPWIATIDEGDRQLLRDHGDRIAGALLVSFDATLAADRTVALAAAEELDATVVNMRFVKPLDAALVASLLALAAAAAAQAPSRPAPGAAAPSTPAVTTDARAGRGFIATPVHSAKPARCSSSTDEPGATSATSSRPRSPRRTASGTPSARASQRGE